MGPRRMRNRTWDLAWRAQEVSEVKKGVLDKYKRKPDVSLSHKGGIRE